MVGTSAVLNSFSDETTIYLIRHAETVGNTERRCFGWLETDLSKNGLLQVEALKDRFSSIPVDAVYSSDLRRAKITAGAIYRQKRLPLHIETGLRELNFGDWEGRTWEDIDSVSPEEHRRFKTRTPGWRAPNGETVEEVGVRMVKTLQKIAQRHKGQSVAAVSHGASIGAFLAAVQNVPAGEIPLSDNTAVSCITWNGAEFKVIYMIDNSHLPPHLSSISVQTAWHRKFKGEAQ